MQLAVAKGPVDDCSAIVLPFAVIWQVMVPPLMPLLASNGFSTKDVDRGYPQKARGNPVENLVGCRCRAASIALPKK